MSRWPGPSSVTAPDSNKATPRLRPGGRSAARGGRQDPIPAPQAPAGPPSPARSPGPAAPAARRTTPPSSAPPSRQRRPRPASSTRATGKQQQSRRHCRCRRRIRRPNVREGQRHTRQTLLPAQRQYRNAIGRVGRTARPIAVCRARNRNGCGARAARVRPTRRRSAAPVVPAAAAGPAHDGGVCCHAGPQQRPATARVQGLHPAGHGTRSGGSGRSARRSASAARAARAGPLSTSHRWPGLRSISTQGRPPRSPVRSSCSGSVGAGGAGRQGAGRQRPLQQAAARQRHRSLPARCPGPDQLGTARSSLERGAGSRVQRLFRASSFTISCGGAPPQASRCGSTR